MLSIGKVALSGCFGLLLSSSGVIAFAPRIHLIQEHSAHKASALRLIPSPSSMEFRSETLSGAFIRQTRVFGSSKSEVVPGVGDEGCALPSPSMVNTLPLNTQLAVVLGYCLALYGGTVGLVTGIDALKHSYPESMANWMTTWPILGLLFMLAGLSHFSNAEGYINMMPAQGAWGVWYLPGSKEFHVAWTGVVEFLAGLWLTIGAVSTAIFGISLPDAFQLGTGSITGDASFVLLVVTILVTPANIYMFTHGALLPPMAMEPVPVAGHAARAVLQALLFAIFYEMAIPTIYVLQNLSV